MSCLSLAVVLTLVQTKQVRINIHKQRNTKNTVHPIPNTVNTSMYITKTPSDARDEWRMYVISEWCKCLMSNVSIEWVTYMLNERCTWWMNDVSDKWTITWWMKDLRDEWVMYVMLYCETFQSILTDCIVFQAVSCIVPFANPTIQYFIRSFPEKQ